MVIKTIASKTRFLIVIITLVLTTGVTKSQCSKLANYGCTAFETKGDVSDFENEKWETMTNPFPCPVAAVALAHIDNHISSDHDWIPLFNGKNLEGWQVKCIEKDKDKNFWYVKDGNIVCNSLQSSDHHYVWLQTEEEFADFELRLKFQVSKQNKGNSGVQFRSRFDENSEVEEGYLGWMDGPQVDISPADPWRTGYIYDETRSNKRWIYPSLPDWKMSKDEYEPEHVNFYFEDEETGWNDLIIICDGMQIMIMVNDIVVSDFNAAGILDDASHTKLNVSDKGHIALQIHKNDQNLLKFKDIEIRRLNK